MTGFIGLGIMGKPMAANLLKSGFSLLVNDVSKAAMQALEGLGACQASLREIGEACDVIFTNLPNGEIVQQVLFGAGEVITFIQPGALVVDLSSVTPVQSQYCYRRLKEKGVQFLDAPVSGGEPKAIDGTLALMVGGDKSAYQRAVPYFESMGASWLRIGDSGSGSVAKLANQIIVNNTIAAVSEALVLASKAGADAGKVYQAIRGGLAGSAVLDAKAPLMIEHAFRPGGKISVNHKDIMNVMATAHELSVPLPLTSQLLEIMTALKASGNFEDDHAGIVQYYERLAGIEVGTAKPTRPVTCLDTLPALHGFEPDRELSERLANFHKKIVVLDDDPTGVQTVHGISVYTDWTIDSLRAAFAEPGNLFFVLTNSRGFTEAETVAAHETIAQNLAAISKETGTDFVVISRSDSTLRGHFPAETETLRAVLEPLTGWKYDGEVVMPFFLEGGRYTLGDTHYVRAGDALVPAGDTEFAQDKTFGYKNSHLGAWCEEKTGGTYAAQDMIYISIEELRAADIGGITKKLESTAGFNKIIVNSASYEDVKVFAIALLDAMARGHHYMIRSAASIVKVLGNVTDKPLLTRKDLVEAGNTNGGIVLIGSHVNKTTRQLEVLQNASLPVVFIKFDQHLVLQPGGLAREVDRVVAKAEHSIAGGRTVVIYTRRDRLDLPQATGEEQLRISVEISDAVTSIIGKLSVRPAFIIAKGGITSSDVGTKALGVRRATVMGQIQKGIPVWMTGEESKFPGMPYVIFPGNVGEDTSLREMIEQLIKNP